MTSPPSLQGYRLSPPQRHLWAQHGPTVGPHRVLAVVTIDGPIELAALDRAVRTAVAEHEAFRTTYHRLPGMTDPVQVVHEHPAWSFACEELAGLDAPAHAATIEARRRALAEMPIDLERGPVCAARVLRSGGRSTLLLMWPSLVADAASAGVVVRQLANELDAGRGGAAPAGDARLQHLDLSDWQYELLEAEGTVAGREFWRALDREAVSGCRLPLRNREAPRGPFVPRTLQSPLAPEALAGAGRWAAAHGRTLGDVLFACWQLLASRLAERAGVCLGVHSAGRSLAGLSDVVAPLAKSLPVRLLVDRRWTFARLVERSQATLQECRRWHEVFAWSLPGAQAAAPAVPVCPLAFEAFDEEAVDARGGVRISNARVDACLDRFELKLSLFRADGGCQTRWAFDDRVHAAEQIACIAEEYASVVRQVAEGPPPALEDFDVRGDRDREASRRLGRALPVHPARHDACVHWLFDAQARLTPARVAATCGGERVTYRELQSRAQDVARVLRAHGVGPETRVAVLLEHSIDLLAAVLGVLSAGGAFVPLAPGQPIARLARLADRTRAPFLVTRRPYVEGWPDDCATRPVLLEDWPSLAAAADRAPAAPAMSPDNLCYVMFTSGSTGEPNGVMISHRAFVSYLRWCQTAYLRDLAVDVPLHSPVGFDATLTSLLVPLCTGARVVVIPQEDAGGTIRGLTGTSTSFGFLKVTPAHLGLIAGDAAPGRLPGLTGLLIVGGEALDAGQLAPWRHHAPSTRVINEYGPTETTVGCVVYQARAADLVPGPVPIGHPISGVDCCIADDHGHPAATGVAGELYIGGAQVARGYERRPDLTAARFVPAPFGGEPGARWYRTGDRVRLRADGALEYVGRRDDQVKLHGHRVELGEVEAACRRQNGIRHAAVALRADAAGVRRLVAYAVAADGASPTIDRLQDGLRLVLPEYMLPSRLVVLDEMPLTPHGKVDRSRLPAPPDERPALTETYAEPRAGAEAILAGIWAEVLHVDRVGRSDNFFALGGDSILSLQMVARAARAGLRLAPRHVFDHQTIEALAAVAERAGGAERADEPVSGPVPLTPIQLRFFEQALEAPHHHNHAVVVELTPPFDAAGLHHIWLALQRHHDALRMTYRSGVDGWTQANGGIDRVVPPTWIDGAAIDPGRRETAWRRVADASQTSLDLVNGPLARAAIVRWNGGSPMHLLLVVHHLVVDGASWQVLLDDLSDLCMQARSQPDPTRWTLPPKTMSFKRRAEQVAALARGGGFDSQLALWLEMSASGAPVPEDHALGRNDVASERTHRCSLSASETEELLHRVPGTTGVPAPDVLMTGVIWSLSRWAGAGAWRIDVERHGREPIEAHDDLSRTVGWFTSIHPVRVETAAADTPIAVLRTVRSALGRIPDAGMGYGALRYLGSPDVARRLSEPPDPEVVFNYWGQVDHGLASSAPVRPAAAPAGRTRAAGHQREYVLDVSASVTDGRLHVWWTYSANLHRAGTIERLARTFLEAIRTVLAAPAAVRGSLRTPADFPLADVSQSELDDLVARGGIVSDVYSLSPLQEALLFQRLYDADGSTYVQQCRARVRGPLDPDAFRAAWEAAVARHDTLRTAFSWERSGGPLAVVYEAATLPWQVEDWRSLPAADRQLRVSEFLRADARRGFAPGTPPLTRIALLRLDDIEWEVVWTSHHLVLDGWSGQLILSDVFGSYFAFRSGTEAPPLPPAGRYADYIAWLREQDQGRAQDFWARHLAGLRDACLLAPPAAPGEPAARAIRRATLPPPLVGALQALTQARHITMNTWFAGTWGVLLAFCSKRDDVVFGTVVSGRPPHLPGIETMTGLFANTLPLRLRVVRTASALSFFAGCQRAQVDARDHEHVSLARIRGWIDVPAGVPLFDTLVAYENYPAAAVWRQPTDVHVVDLDTSVPTEYPLGVDIGRIDNDLVVTLSFDEERIGAALAAFVLEGFEAVFSRLVTSPDCTVGDLFDALDDRANRSLATTDERRLSHRQALRAMRQGTRAGSTSPHHADAAR